MNSKYLKIIPILAVSLTMLHCTKKTDDAAPTTNVATEVVANLTAVSANYNPNSLAQATSRTLKNRSGDPCQGVSDFATCQSNLIRAYNQLGKQAVDSVAQFANQIGAALGQVADGSTGTSDNGLVSWNKTSSANWSVIFRGAGNASQVYISILNGVYTLKADQSVDTSDPINQQIEVAVNFTNSNTWDVDLFLSNSVCNATDVGAPSKIQIKVSLANNLWTGKAMLYSSRWNPAGASVTCSTAAGTSEITMYTDYVGNDTSTKASLYLIPAATASLASISSFDLNDFCTNFASNCGGSGQPTAGYLAAYPNPWCTTGPNTAPTWNDTCTTNATVSAASYSNASNWITPSALKAKMTTLPTSL